MGHLVSFRAEGSIGISTNFLYILASTAFTLAGITMASLEERSQYAAGTEPSATAATDGRHILTPSPSTRRGGGDNLAPASKRRRINFACEYCRSRKTRCDEGYPSCYACSAAGIECVTKNRRQPWLDVRRHEAGKVPDRSRTEETPRRNPNEAVMSVGESGPPLVASGRGDGDIVAFSRRCRPQQHRSSEATNAERSSTPTPNQDSLPVQVATSMAYEPATFRVRQIHGTTSHGSDAAQDDDERSELNARLPLVQIDSGNTSLELMTSWLDLARYRLRIPRSGNEPPSQPTRDPMNRSARSHNDSALPSSLGTWLLPGPETSQALADRFLHGPNVLFPLLQPEKIKHAIQTASLHGPNSLAQRRGIPVLMQVYLVMILGSASQPGQEIDFDAEGCLKYSESLLGLILQQSTVEALQAVTLLSMALRCYDNLAAAAHTMSLAVSMGVALGLPRHSPRLPRGEDRRTTWTTVYAFEKLLSFELGRSSLIPDEYPALVSGSYHAKQPQRSVTDDEATTGSQKERFQAISEVVLSLAKLLGEVGRSCVQVSTKEDDRSDETLAEVIIEKVRTTGLSCLKLMEWASEVRPSRYR